MEICLRISVKDLMCLFSVLIGVTAVVSEEESVFRQKDIPFERESKVMNKTVTCGEKNWGVFPFLTYTCDDIKVNGLRLAYGYYPGWGVDENCQETEGPQELTMLCKLLLRTAIKHYNHFKGIVVNNATCRRTEKKRYRFVKRAKRRYKWEVVEPGHGWLSSLSCMVEP
ncbi:uncharacterized protein LOC143290908 [Babylonia areolata]|uniref:uncharacterized protein LOC143290908 n=1 Tax=Babylonia areolata TaxID=304850 RepID=UPI003FD5B376